jgi:hypothetical protein
MGNLEIIQLGEKRAIRAYRAFVGEQLGNSCFHTWPGG